MARTPGRNPGNPGSTPASLHLLERIDGDVYLCALGEIEPYQAMESIQETTAQLREELKQTEKARKDATERAWRYYDRLVATGVRFTI